MKVSGSQALDIAMVLVLVLMGVVLYALLDRVRNPAVCVELSRCEAPAHIWDGDQ